jgi:hypothetical protein
VILVNGCANKLETVSNNMGKNNAKFNNNAGINKVDLKGVLFPILNNSYVLKTENTNNTKLNSSVPKFKSVK